MGIYDREYIRRDQPGFFGSFTTGRGQVCKWLIVVNGAFFLAQLVTLGPPEGGRFDQEERRLLELQEQRRLEPDEEHRLLKLEKERQLKSRGPVTGGLILDVDAVLHGQIWRLLTYA